MASRCGSAASGSLNGVVFLAALAGGRLDRLHRAERRGAGACRVATWIMIFFGLALLFGVLMTLPIGGADMPVVISIYNAFTGLAVGFEGYVLRQSGADDRRHGGRVRRASC